MSPVCLAAVSLADMLRPLLFLSALAGLLSGKRDPPNSARRRPFVDEGQRQKYQHQTLAETQTDDFSAPFPSVPVAANMAAPWPMGGGTRVSTQSSLSLCPC